VLAVGYCSPSTLGAKIIRGDKAVSIHGNMYEVRADITRIESYSGHGDYEEMIGFLNCQNKDKLQHVAIVHGEFKTQENYKRILEERGFKNILIPDVGDSLEL
jgi:metallo-beta-lactamase family protein